MSASFLIPVAALAAALGFSALTTGCGSSRDPVSVPGARVLPWMEAIGPEWQRTAFKLEFGDTVVWYHGTAAGDFVEGKKWWIGRVEGQVVAEARVAGRQSLIFSEMLDFHPSEAIRSNGGVTQTTEDRLSQWIERRRGPTAPPAGLDVPSAVPPPPAYRGPSATNPVTPTAQPMPEPPAPEKPAWKRWLWPF